MEEIRELLPNNRMQFAVLIDADNVSPRYVKTIFEELEKYGQSSNRRIYGDWSKPNGWENQILLEYSIKPMQQFPYTKGKNATDIAMVIEAMDILYKNKVQGFCLVTSDSDFTGLAARLQEDNIFVLGMGESRTPLAMTKACNRFIHLDLVDEHTESSSQHDDEQSLTPITEVRKAVLAVINENEGNKVNLSIIGQRLNEKFSDFDVRNYGYSKLSTLVEEEMPDLTLDMTRETNQYFVERKEVLTKTELEKEICEIIKKHGGSIAPLSVLNQELLERHKQLDFKQFGYSRISSFLRSLGSVKTDGNQVSLKGRK